MLTPHTALKLINETYSSYIRGLFGWY